MAVSLDPSGINNGQSDAAASISALLGGGDRDIYIPPGVYRCDSTLQLRANTRLEMSPQTTLLHNAPVALNSAPLILNGESGNSQFSSGYSGPGGIIVKGGTIDMQMASDAGPCSQGMALAHCSDLVIEGVRFTNAKQDHFIEFNAVRNAVVRDCRFEGATAWLAGSRECINIDYSFAAGFPHFGSYDGTICDNILIDHCRFDGADVAVGSHSAPPAGPHKKIVVRDCDINGMQSCGIDVRYWDEDSRIERTRISGVPLNSEYRGTLVRIDGRVLVQALESGAAVYIPMRRSVAGQNPQGMVTLSGWSNQATSPRGLVWVHCANPVACVPIAVATSATFNLTTGVLTGTTGPAGKVSISAHLDGIYLENQRGLPLWVELRFLGN